MHGLGLRRPKPGGNSALPQGRGGNRATSHSETLLRAVSAPRNGIIGPVLAETLAPENGLCCLAVISGVRDVTR